MMASSPVYQFYAELEDYRPKMWRRFQVMNGITVARLGYILQVLFEMKACHLMAIEVPREENFRAWYKKRFPEMATREAAADKERGAVDHYEIPDDEFDEGLGAHKGDRFLDATRERLSGAVSNPNDKLSFHYDFGDDWWVSLKLEAIFTDKELPGDRLPRVLEGAGFGIVEDVGGPGGLQRLAKAFQKKSGAEYEQLSEWLGVKTLDLKRFDLDDMNFRLKKIPRIYKQCYEDQLSPTRASIALLEREYLKKA